MLAQITERFCFDTSFVFRGQPVCRLGCFSCCWIGSLQHWRSLSLPSCGHCWCKLYLVQKAPWSLTLSGMQTESLHRVPASAMHQLMSAVPFYILFSCSCWAELLSRTDRLGFEIRCCCCFKMWCQCFSSSFQSQVKSTLSFFRIQGDRWA